MKRKSPLASALLGAVPVAVSVIVLTGTVLSPAAAQEQAQASLPPSVQKSRDDQLAKAVVANDAALVRTLLRKRANPDTLLSEFSGSVLHQAAEAGHTEVVRALLDHNAGTVQRDTHFKTARELAVENGHTVIADLLRQAEDGVYRKPPPLTAPTKTSTPRPIPAKRVAAAPPKKPKPRAYGSPGASRQAGAYKKLKDDNYVKNNFGLGGATYRSSKW